MKKMEEGRRERGESREGRRPEAAGCRLQAPASSLQPLASTYFLPYQAAWITDGGHLKICEKGRQIGLSYADSYDSVRKAAVAKSGRDVWVMSRDEVQAKQYIRYCKRWAQVLRYAAEEHGEELFTTTAGKAIQAQALTFKSGASIYALSSNPDAIVGKTGHVKLDEFALHKDQRTLYAVAKPVIQWGGTLSIISTHRGAGTVFNELLRDVKERGNPMGWSHHCIPIQRAVEDGLVEKIAQASERGSVEASERGSSNAPTLPRSDAPTLRAAWLARQRAECIDQEQWLQEYCCVPADESSAFITYDLMAACHEANCLKDFAYLLDCKNPLYLGVDVARKKDLCVLDVGEKIGDVLWDRVRVELQNKTFAEIKYELYRLLRLPQLKRCCMDATGLGMQIAEEAKRDFGWKVEPISFTGPVKEELAFGLRADFEARRVRIPANDDPLMADLRGIKKEVTLGGNIRFVGESQDSHCDRFWAKALRQQAARAVIELGVMVG